MWRMSVPAPDHNPDGLQRRFQLHLCRCPPHSHSERAFLLLSSLFSLRCLAYAIYDHLGSELPRVAAQALQNGQSPNRDRWPARACKTANVTTDVNTKTWNHACIRAIGATDESILAV